MDEGGRLTKYQAMPIHTPEIILKTCQTLNPATLTPGPAHHTSVEHNCSETIDLVYSRRPDLKDSPIKNADDDWFTDGSSFLDKGERRAGYAIVSLIKTIEAKPFPINTCAQKAEIIALTCALQLAKGLKINIYTDSKYALLVLHAHGAIWKERGLLPSHDSPIKHGPQIITLLEAVHLPKEVVVIHLKGHRKDMTLESKGNSLADRAAKGAAQNKQILRLIPVLTPVESITQSIQTKRFI